MNRYLQVISCDWERKNNLALKLSFIVYKHTNILDIKEAGEE